MSTWLPLSLYKVEGHSMEPTFQSGAIIIVNKLAYRWKKPQIKDLVLFRINGLVILKRIQSIKGRQILVVGDNKNDSQEFGWVKKEALIGKVLGKIF